MAVAVLLVVGGLAASACSRSGPDRSEAAGSTTVAPASVSVPDRAPAEGRGPGGFIVFEGGVGTATRLYLMDVATEQVQQLTHRPSWAPQVSPDGREVVYSSGVVDDSVQSERLDLLTGDTSTVDGFCSSFASDGNLLVVGRTGQLELVGRDGEVVAEVQPGGRPGCGVEIARGEYVVWHDDDRIDRIRSGVATPAVSMPPYGLGPVAVRHRDGALAFDVQGFDPDRNGVYVLDSTGGSPRPVLLGLGHGVAWSPDGSWLAMARRDPESGRYRLTLVRPDGSDARTLATPVEVGLLAWGPSAGSSDDLA